MLIIPRHLLRLLHTIRDIYRNTEVSGYLSFTVSDIAKNECVCNSIYVQSPFISKINSVEDIPKRAYIPTCRTTSDFNAQIVFHTHPEKCYLDNYAGLGIPSYTDVMTSINGLIKHGQKIQIIISIEGCYIMHLMNNKIVDNVAQSKDILHTQYRQIQRDVFTTDDDRRVNTIHSFLKHMNTDFMRTVFIDDYNTDIHIDCKLNIYTYRNAGNQ